MLNQQQIEKLELYHKGKLTDEEKKELKQSVLDNPDFKAEAEGLLDLFKGFDAIQLEKFENDLSLWEKECASSAAEKKETKIFSLSHYVNRYKYAAVAVILILFLPLGYVLFQNMNSSDSEKLFEANAEPFLAIQMNTRSLLGAPDPFQSIKDKGISLYNEKKYTQALNQFKDYYAKTDEKHKTFDIKFYLALSNLFLGNTNDAESFLLDIISKETNESFKETTEWYLSLCYLKAKNIQKSIDMLNEISVKENHSYHTKAKALLPKVKRLQ